MRVAPEQDALSLMPQVRPICPVLSSACGTCGTDKEVITMLSIERTRLCRNLSVAREVVDEEAV